MNDDFDLAQPPDSDGVWQTIEKSLDEIAQLAKADLTVGEFHAGLLERVVRALAAIGGVVWLVDRDGQLQLDYQLHLEDALLTIDEAGQQSHSQLLHSVLRNGRPRLMLPHTGDAELRNPTSLLLILCPLAVHGAPLGVVEIFQRPETSAALQRGYLRILTTACELAGDFHRDRQLQELAQREAFGNQLRQFSLAAHASLELRATAYALANEGRRLIACDRLSVIVRRGSRAQLVAISGVDTFQRRASVVQRLEALAELVSATGESLWHPDDRAPRAPQLETALQSYLDEAHARFLAVVPLRDARTPQPASASSPGTLVVEQFSSPLDDRVRPRLQAVCDTAALALRSSLEYEGIPLLPWLRRVHRASWYARVERLPRLLTVTGLVLALLLVAFLVPADFQITARGELQPRRRYHLFAPSDGVVVALPKKQGDSVRRGEVVIILSNPKLDLEFAEIAGKLRTSEEQLAAVGVARLRNDAAAVNARDRLELTAQEEQLKERMAGLEKQLQILTEQQQALEVPSPTDGQVLTWDVERLLASRPVQRGERLLTVADLSGLWELELRIDDDQAGHVVAARQALGERLEVSFLLATNPGVSYAGTIREVATATDVDDAGRPQVLAVVDLAGADLPQPRPGATVVARLHCGRRSIGYVWLRQVWEAIQSRILF